MAFNFVSMLLPLSDRPVRAADGASQIRGIEVRALAETETPELIKRTQYFLNEETLFACGQRLGHPQWQRYRHCRIRFGNAC